MNSKHYTITHGLSLTKNDDGYWLNFESPDGKKASLNLNVHTPDDETSIIRAAVIGWCKHHIKINLGSDLPKHGITRDQALSLLQSLFAIHLTSPEGEGNLYNYVLIEALGAINPKLKHYMAPFDIGPLRPEIIDRRNELADFLIKWGVALKC